MTTRRLPPTLLAATAALALAACGSSTPTKTAAAPVTPTVPTTSAATTSAATTSAATTSAATTSAAPTSAAPTSAAAASTSAKACTLVTKADLEKTLSATVTGAAETKAPAGQPLDVCNYGDGAGTSVSVGGIVGTVRVQASPYDKTTFDAFYISDDPASSFTEADAVSGLGDRAYVQVTKDPDADEFDPGG